MPDFQSILTYAILGLIAFIAVVIYRSFSSRTTMRMVVDKSGLKSHRGIPPRVVREIETFFEQDVSILQKLTIKGRINSKGCLRFRFRGTVDHGMKQQIRNFLHSIL